jgi:hypothetical protein
MSRQAPLGSTVWVVPEGYLPASSTGPEPEMTSHGTLCILNTGDQPASIELTIYFADREPVGPYRLRVDPRRTLHQRFNNLDDPAPIPRGTDFASVLRADRPVVVQHTRLDSRQPANAIMTTIAYPAQNLS